jgi:PAS domain S-box-containing protein
MRAEGSSLNTTTPAAPASPGDSVQQRFQLLIDAVVDYGIFMLDPQGHVMSWNAGAEKLKGYTREQIIGKHFSIFYPPEAVASGWPQEELRRALKLGRFEDEGWRIRRDGSRFWANVIITALHGANGELTGFAKITRDLTERRQHEEALRQSEERFRLLVGSVRGYAIYMLDPDGMVQSWNAGARAIKGYEADEIIGRHFSVFYTPEEQKQGKPQRELEIAGRDGSYEEEGWRVRKDGTLFWANVVVTAVHGADGALLGFAKVTRDMTERRKLEDLERSSRRMNEFLAMLAHELRNPLAPIRNSVTVMQLQPLPTPELRHCRDVINRQVTHITRLVDDLLDVGRLNTGKIKLRLELLKLAEVVAHAVETAKPVVEARRHTLEVTLPGEDVYVNADSTRLSQIVQNLIINAAKYTPEGGRISLSAAISDGFVSVSVSDNGRGIAPEDLERIFQLFAQAEDIGSAPNESGLGIGLTLARSLVEMHGGALEAHSEGLGRGSTFRFWLPRAGTAAEEARDEASPADAPQQLRVLVVDDNRDAADSTTAILRLLGHSAESSYDGAQALEIAERFKPHLVLLDLAMPGMDGFATYDQLRGRQGLDEAYFVAMTGFGNEDDRRRTRDAGFDAHLTKPVELDALVELLNASRS